MFVERQIGVCVFCASAPVGALFIIRGIKMFEKPQKKKTSFLCQPFDLNRNGKIDPSEAALIMMVIDDCEKDKAEPCAVNNQIVDIEDLNIKGI